jgi:hypothetical protein
VNKCKVKRKTEKYVYRCYINIIGNLQYIQLYKYCKPEKTLALYWALNQNACNMVVRDIFRASCYIVSEISNWTVKMKKNVTVI